MAPADVVRWLRRRQWNNTLRRCSGAGGRNTFFLSLLARREALGQRAEGLTAGVDGYESAPASTPGESYRGQGALEPARAPVTSAHPPGGRALRAGEYHDGLQALRGIAAMGV